MRLVASFVAFCSVVVGCSSATGELPACIEGRWTIEPDEGSSILEQLPRSAVTYEIRSGTLVLSTTTGEAIARWGLKVEAIDARRGWLVLDSGERLEIEASQACDTATLVVDSARTPLRRVSR